MEALESGNHPRSISVPRTVFQRCRTPVPRSGLQWVPIGSEPGLGCGLREVRDGTRIRLDAIHSKLFLENVVTDNKSKRQFICCHIDLRRFE